MPDLPFIFRLNTTDLYLSHCLIGNQENQPYFFCAHQSNNKNSIEALQQCLRVHILLCPKSTTMTKNVMQRITEKLNQPEEYENI